MIYDVYLKTGEVQQAECQVESLGNGYDKYSLLYNGQRVQSGVVKTGKAETQVKKYFSRLLSVECMFVAE